MNKENAKDYLPLVQALADGKVIQVHVCVDVGKREWRDLDGTHFDRAASDYRIKPEPREVWANRYDSGREVVGYVSRERAMQQVYEAGAVQVLYREVIE